MSATKFIPSTRGPAATYRVSVTPIIAPTVAR
jgi:hypothetical protein